MEFINDKKTPVSTRFRSRNSRIKPGKTYIYTPCLSDKNEIYPFKAQFVVATGTPFFFNDPVNGRERCEVSSLDGKPLGHVSTCGLIEDSKTARAFYLNESES